MFHETRIGKLADLTGQVYLRFGTAKKPGHLGPDNLVAVGVTLNIQGGLQPIDSNVMMSHAEAIRLSEELRRLASLIKL